MQRGNIGGFIRYFLKKENAEVRIASFYLLRSWLQQGWKPSEDFKGFFEKAVYDIRSDESSVSFAENELIGAVCRLLNLQWDDLPVHESADRVLFLENLKTERSWMYKIVNLYMLRQKYEQGDINDESFNAYVGHLLILLRLNPDEIVFRLAGEDLLRVADVMSDPQKYEVMKELFKVIETGYDATGYVPGFMGRFYDRLSLQAQIELLSDIEDLTSSQNAETAGSMLETICCMLSNLAVCEDPEPEKVRIIHKLCGFLSQSLYGDMEEVVRHIICSAGDELFMKLVLCEKEQIKDHHECFADLARNILICMSSRSITDLLCHTGTAQAIALWLGRYNDVFPDAERPVAFYSGTFDPFSNGHYAIVREIAEMGFQVYVQVHDLAPNQHVQPLLIRRQIAAMSVTDMSHVQLFPGEITINTEVPKDLVRLSAIFPDRKVWLVERSARVENDDIYQTEPHEGSVHGFPHIVFVRGETYGYYDDTEFLKHLTGEVMTLKLPAYYEDMTAVEIRRRIQSGKSINGLVGTRVRNYINKYKLYTVNNSDKPDIPEFAVDTLISDGMCEIILPRDGGRCAGTLRYRKTMDEGVAIESIEMADEKEELEELLLDEALMAFQAEGVAFATCSPEIISCDKLKRRGFIPSEDGRAKWTVCMDSPIVLFTDSLSSVAVNMSSDERLRSVSRENARHLLEATAELFPGTLILNVHSEVLNYRLSERIKEKCAHTEGGSICVPFGKILRSVNIPGVVMIPLDSEKRYDQTLASFRICEKKGHPVLSTQMHTIQSMDMPFILVDDLYHKGYRMEKIGNSMENEGMIDDGVIVGVRTDTGRDLADKYGYRVDAIYEVPNMKLWIIESDMIPFFGSDKVEYSAEISVAPEMLPTIYPMLPYQMPAFLKDAPYESVYNLSEVCIRNAIRLFETMELIYKEQTHRTLTFERLAEIIEEPGYPEEALGWHSFQKEEVSGLLKRELVRLKRFKKGGKDMI